MFGNQVTLPKLIAYVLALEQSSQPDSSLVKNMIRTSKFKCLNIGESINSFDLPNKLKSYFDPFIKDLMRFGSLIKYEKFTNVSLYYSILKLCCNTDDIDNEYHKYLHTFRELLIKYVSNDRTFKGNGYAALGWSKKEIININLVNYESNTVILKLIADYFNINILVLNVADDKLYIMSGNEHYDMFRLNVIISLNNDTFEPLIFNNHCMLDHNSDLIKKLISVHKNIIQLYNVNLTDKENDMNHFKIGVEDLRKYVTISKENECNEIAPSETDLNAYVTEIETEKNDVPKININLSSKLKLSELQDIATKLNIVLDKGDGKKKAKTKVELINDIKNILGNSQGK